MVSGDRHADCQTLPSRHSDCQTLPNRLGGGYRDPTPTILGVRDRSTGWKQKSPAGEGRACWAAASCPLEIHGKHAVGPWGPGTAGLSGEAS